MGRTRNGTEEPTELQILNLLDQEHLEDLLPDEVTSSRRFAHGFDDTELDPVGSLYHLESQRLELTLDDAELDHSHMFVPLDDPEWWPGILQNPSVDDGTTMNNNPTTGSLTLERAGRRISRRVRPTQRHCGRRRVDGREEIVHSRGRGPDPPVSANSPEVSRNRRNKGRISRRKKREKKQQQKSKTSFLTSANLPAEHKTLLDSITCPLCMEYYDEGTGRSPCTLPCGHSFCLSHLSQCKKCPICRRDILSSTRGYLKKSVALCDTSKAITSMLSKMSLQLSPVVEDP